MSRLRQLVELDAPPSVLHTSLRNDKPAGETYETLGRCGSLYWSLGLPTQGKEEPVRICHSSACYRFCLWCMLLSPRGGRRLHGALENPGSILYDGDDRTGKAQARS